MSAVPQQKPHWKTRAIQHSEGITDAWEVTKVYCGRLAEWILYICMIMNVLSIFIAFPSAVSNLVLGIQVVTLDIAGFGLQSMADHAKDMGNEKVAGGAKTTSWFLIGLMILTMLLVTIGILIPPLKFYTDWADKLLILVRVVMTVIYGHVVHGLRHVDQQLNVPELLAKAAEVEELKRRDERRAKELKDQQELKEKELMAKANELKKLEAEKAKELMAKDQLIEELMAKVDGLIATEELAKKELMAKVDESDKQRQEAVLALQEIQAKELMAKQKITRKLSPQELKSYELIAPEKKAKEKANVAHELEAKKAKETAKGIAKKELKPMAKGLKKSEPVAINLMSSRDKIKAAMAQLHREGKELKYQTIADLAGVGYSTVKLHFKDISDEMGIAEVRKLRVVNG